MTTQNQKRIIELYKKKLSISFISKTIKCSRTYIYQTLENKGIYKKKCKLTNATTLPILHGKYRLHATHLIIHIISKGSRFYRIKSNEGYIDSHHFKICKNNTIQLLQAKGDIYPASIYADNIKELQNIASTYWNSIILRLQRRLDCLLLKDGYPTITEARSHIAYMDSGIAKEIILEEGKGLYIRTMEGRVFLYFDMSHGRIEHEHIGGKGLSWESSKKIEPFFQDIYHKEFLLPSETKDAIGNIFTAIESLIADRKYYADNLKQHVKAIKTLSRKVQQLGRVFPTYNKNTLKSSQNERQLKLI